MLGFDYGRARIGVAVGQEVTGTARPLAIVPALRQRPDWDAITRLLAQWRPALLIVGVPTHADGTTNDVTRAAQRFSRQLHGRYHLPVALIDERLSSHAAAARQHEAPRGRRSGELDAWAAALILESWFHERRAVAGRAAAAGAHEQA